MLHDVPIQMLSNHQFINRAEKDDYGLEGNRYFWILSNKRSCPKIKSYHYVVGASYNYKDYLFDIEAIVHDSSSGNQIVLSATTQVPSRCGDISLSTYELALEKDMNFSKVSMDNAIYGENNPYPQIKIRLKASENDYHFIKLFTDSSTGLVFENQLIYKVYQYPFKGNHHYLSPIDLQEYGKYKMIVYHVTEDFANLYLDQRIGDIDFGASRLPRIGISNITNGEGIFAAFSCDTVSFSVVPKK